MKKVRLKNPVIRPSEKEIQDSILNYLNARGIFAWRNNVGVSFSEYKGKKYMVRYGIRGSSDIQGIIPPGGRFLAIEVKNHKGKVSVYQEEYLRAVERKGGLAFVARNIETVVEKLELAKK